MSVQGTSPAVTEILKATQTLYDHASKVEQKPDIDMLKADNIVQSIIDNASLLSQLSGIVTSANHLGTQRSEKEMDERSNTIPVMIKALLAKDKLSIDETMLINLYKASHDSKLLIPDWFQFIEPLVHLETRSDNLPRPEACANALTTNNAQIHQLTEACEELYDKYEKLRMSNDNGSGIVGPAGTKTVKAQRQWNDKQAELTNALIALKINPENLSPYSDTTNFQISFNTDITEIALTHYKEIGQLINFITKKGNEELPENFVLSKIIPNINPATRHLSDFEKYDLATSNPISKKSLEPFLPQILESYVSMRRFIEQSYMLHIKTTPPQDYEKLPAFRHIENSLAKSLQTIFPENDVETLNALMPLKDNKFIKSSIRKLLFSKTADQPRQKNSQPFIAQSEYAGFLPEPMSAMLEGDTYSIKQLKSISGQFTPFVEFASLLAKLAQDSRHEDLVELFNKKLEKCTSNTPGARRAPYEEQIAVLVGLVAATDDPVLAPLFRTKLRNKALLSELA